MLESLLTPTLFQLFFAAVAVSTWYGGMEAGLLATTLSSLAIAYFLIEPKYSLLFFNLDDILRLVVFVLVGILISSLNSGLRTAKRHLEISLQHLRSSEARFGCLAESNIIGVIVADINGGIVEANDAFLRMVGYTREELLSGQMQWRDLTPPEYFEVTQRSIQELRERGACAPFEKEYLCQDGRRVPVLKVSALLESNRERIIGFVVDLSERKQAEEALRLLITDAVPALISYVDAQQRYRFNNKGYEEWHGISASDINGKHIKEVVGESVYESIRPYVEAVLSGEHVTYETKLPYQDGKIRYVNVSYVPQFSSKAEVVGFVALIKDITKRKQAELALKQSEERFRQLAEKAEAANRMKDEFLATLSHELRTPLNAILGWTQLLTTRKFNESTTNRALETIDRNTKLLATLIEDVLDVSRIITGKLCLEVRPIQVAPVVLSAIETVNSAANAKEITIETFLDSSVGVVLGDINRLQQIVWNLLSNAVKFTPRGGRVYVRLSTSTEFTDGHSALLQVTDTGEGIAPEFLPYVFERFRQADSSSTRSHGGLGLGLAIVRHLVELHGGTVRAESAGIGQGATFIVSLPIKVTTVELSEPQQLSSTVEVQVAQTSNLKLEGLRVLVVDDEPDARQIITTVLGQYEANVMAVATVTEALIALQQFQPDVLVSDIGMPQEDGYSLIRKVRALDEEKGGRTPAVALTAYARAEDRTQALLAGFQLHVPKPVNPAKLAAVIANLAGRM
ncbi:hypothetical protein NUACC21_71990 [Scytonema sp. NUACC21]